MQKISILFKRTSISTFLHSVDIPWMDKYFYIIKFRCGDIAPPILQKKAALSEPLPFYGLYPS